MDDDDGRNMPYGDDEAAPATSKKLNNAPRLDDAPPGAVLTVCGGCGIDAQPDGQNWHKTQWDPVTQTMEFISIVCVSCGDFCEAIGIEPTELADDQSHLCGPGTSHVRMTFESN